MSTSRIRFIGAIAGLAFAASSTGAHACAATTAPANVGPALYPLLPVVCSIVAPAFVSAVDGGRKLEDKEVWATTLTCFTGPIGYAIALEKGWIQPCSERRRKS